MPRLLVNALLFQIGWLACVLGSNGLWLLVPVAALLVHFFWTSSWAEDGKLVVSVFLAGSALDSFLLQMGVFSFSGDSPLIPLWLALLWALLGTTLNHCLQWSGRHWLLAALVGGIGGPLAYFGGAKLADVGLPLGMWPSLLLLGLVWLAVLPILHGFARLYREQHRLRVAGKP